MLTFLLCLFIPEKAMISVEHAVDLAPAISQIIKLNPSIIWDVVDFNYPLPADPKTGKMAVELWFEGCPKFVNPMGRVSYDNPK